MKINKTVLIIKKDFKTYSNNGIDLINVESKPRKKTYKTSHKNIEAVDYEDLWFMVNNDLAIYKTFNFNKYKNLKEFRKTNEIVCYELAKQIDLNCAKCDYAHLNDSDGIIIYNFLNKNQKLVSASKILPYESWNSFDNYIENLKEYQLRNGLYNNQKELLENLFKLGVFDILTFQTNRQKNNVYFIENKLERTLTPSPILNNEFAFGTTIVYDIISRNRNLAIDIKLTKDEFIKEFDNCSYNLLFDNDSFRNYKENIKKIVLIASTNKKYASFLFKALKQIDIKQCLYKLKKNGVNISKDQELLYTRCVEISKDLFIKEIEKHETNFKDIVDIKHNKKIIEKQKTK